jgi:hypothetical protein
VNAYVRGVRNWRLWIDYHRTDAEGLTHGNIRNVAPGTKLVVGDYILVGNEEADPAVAEVVHVGPNGWSWCGSCPDRQRSMSTSSASPTPEQAANQRHERPSRRPPSKAPSCTSRLTKVSSATRGIRRLAPIRTENSWPRAMSS